MFRQLVALQLLTKDALILLKTCKATVTILPELTLTSSLSMERTQGTTMNFLDPHEIQYGRDTYGTGYDARSIRTTMTFDNILNYKKY